jgi:hypothetical protein
MVATQGPAINWCTRKDYDEKGPMAVHAWVIPEQGKFVPGSK